MVVSSLALCSHSIASQSVAVSAVCCKSRLLDAHPDKRRLPFSTSDKTTGTPHRCVSSARRRTFTCSCSSHRQAISAPGQARDHAQATRKAWQLHATRNSKQDRVTKQVEEVKVCHCAQLEPTQQSTGVTARPSDHRLSKAIPISCHSFLAW